MESMDPQRHITLGDSQDAEDWVRKSTLPVSVTEAMLRFIRRFPGFVFYKEDDVFLDQVEARETVHLTQSLRDMRKTLAFAVPDQEDILVQLDCFIGGSPRSDHLHEVWYRMGLIGYSNDEQRGLLEQANLFPIGHWWGRGDSSLAINLQSDKSPVYEFCEEDLWDNIADGVPPFDSAYPVFDTYSEIYDIGYLRNWGLFISIFLAGLCISKVFKQQNMNTN